MAEKKTKFESLFGLFIIVIGLLGLYLLYFEDQNPTKSAPKAGTPKAFTTNSQEITSQSKLTKLWRNDFKVMQEEGLPEEFKGIWQIKVFMLDKNLHFLLKGLKAPVETVKNGVYNLEVTFISHYSEDLKKDMLIIQYNIIDIETENMILETSRQIVLEDDFLKEKAES